MRIRRLTTAADFWASLASSESDVLPLWFSDLERNVVSNTIHSAVGLLAPGAEHPFEEVAVRSGLQHWVITTNRLQERLIASRYAMITGRRCITVNWESRPALPLDSGIPESATWFCALNEADLARSLHFLFAEFTSLFGRTPPLGVMAAENAARFSWLMAKQLVGDLHNCNDITYVSTATAVTCSKTTQIGASSNVAEAVAHIHEVTGALIINGHSRPHCGVLKLSDGELGICGAPSGGAGGVCVFGTNCYFGDGPRVILQDLRARRVLFNGCTTGGVDCRHADFLPRAAMISHAALRGSAREFVGNFRVGHYEDSDLEWFLGASALGYTPAESVEIMDRARYAAGRERMRAAVYFGDAMNPAWPVQGTIVGEVSNDGDFVRIRWPQPERTLVARVDGSTLAALAESDRLYAAALGLSAWKISVTASPRGDASLVLATPDADNQYPQEPVEIGFAALPEPVDRTVGGVLMHALERVRLLQSLPVFTKILEKAPSEMEAELVLLRRSAASRADCAMLPQRMSYITEREERAARQFDRPLIDQALYRSRSSWNWQAEYGHRVHEEPQGRPSICPTCGGFASDVLCTDLVYPLQRRLVRACGFCGVVADLPIWDLDLQILSDTLKVRESELRGTALIRNYGKRTLRVAAGVAIVRGGEMQQVSTAKAELVASPATSVSFPFQLLPQKPMREIMQTRLYVACEGGFGFASVNILYGRA